MEKDTVNIPFQLALDFVLYTDKHIFLTGKAGSGKTTFLKQLKQNCHKNMVILAPTGVAAINAGGITIHSFFNYPLAYFCPVQPCLKNQWNFITGNPCQRNLTCPLKREPSCNNWK